MRLRQYYVCTPFWSIMSLLSALRICNSLRDSYEASTVIGALPHDVLGNIGRITEVRTAAPRTSTRAAQEWMNGCQVFASDALVACL
ncbi:hypothetical protein V8C42DRAFT_307974 [Trichoderma barbatum]